MRNRAINWIVKAQDRKMIAAFLQLPGLPGSAEGRVLFLCTSAVKMYPASVRSVIVSSESGKY